MNCSVCGTQLPEGAANCPECGAAIRSDDSPTEAAASNPTVVSSSSPAAQPPPPPTMYGSSPYGAAPAAAYDPLPYGTAAQDPYSSPPYQNPYEPYPIATPPSPKRSGKRTGVIIGVLLLVLLLIGGSVFTLLEYASARNAAAAAAIATATAQAHAAATASASAAVQHFTAKGSFTILSRTNVSFRQDGQNKVYSYTQHEIDYGSVTGSITVEETSIVHPDNTANFYGTSTCTCTVDGKSGTLVYSYTGTSTADGSFQGQDFDGHGTGGLTKLHGQGTFQGQGLHGSYISQLYFDT